MCGVSRSASPEGNTVRTRGSYAALGSLSAKGNGPSTGFLQESRELNSPFVAVIAGSRLDFELKELVAAQQPQPGSFTARAGPAHCQFGGKVSHQLKMQTHICTKFSIDDEHVLLTAICTRTGCLRGGVHRARPDGPSQHPEQLRWWPRARARLGRSIWCGRPRAQEGKHDTYILKA